MKGVNDFIIQIKDPFAEKFKTESGTELYADKRWMPQQLSNRIGVVISVPFAFETEIQSGHEVLIDPTILFEQDYHLTSGTQESIFLVDKEKSLYKIQPNLIVLHRENSNSKWNGHMNNGLFEKVKAGKVEEIKSILFIPDNAQKEFEEGIAKVFISNEDLGAKSGQKVYVKEDHGIEFFLDGKSYWWYRNEDVLAIIESNGLDTVISWRDSESNYDTEPANRCLIDEAGQWPSFSKKIDLWEIQTQNYRK